MAGKKGTSLIQLNVGIKIGRRLITLHKIVGDILRDMLIWHIGNAGELIHLRTLYDTDHPRRSNQILHRLFFYIRKSQKFLVQVSSDISIGFGFRKNLMASVAQRYLEAHSLVPFERTRE